MRLRRRLNTVLLQWFLLLVLISGTVWVIAVPGLRATLVDDRQELAGAVARALDATLAASSQALDQLAADLPAAKDPAPLLHAFRLHSPFSDATYIVDDAGQVIASDPSAKTPIPLDVIRAHEGVTPAVVTDTGAVVAVVQPFKVGTADRYAISEMRVASSSLRNLLAEMPLDASLQVTVLDANRAVVASRTDAPDASDVIAVTAPLRFAPWQVRIAQPRRLAFAGLTSLNRGFLITAFVLVLASVLLAGTLSRSVVRPIHQLSQQAERMRGGDLSSAIAVSGDHEIAVLGRTLDEARVRLATTLGALQAFNERLEAEVASRTAVIAAQNEQRKVLVRKMISATEDERRRLARELHDEIAQLLTVIQLSLHEMEATSPAVARATALLAQTQAEVHRIIHDLRPSLLDDLGLAAAMRSWAEDHLKPSGVQFTLDIDEALPHAPERDTVIFRIFQELVTNVLRHAQAEQVAVSLYARDGRIVLEVEDDGRGFDADAKTNRAGVTGMRERAALVNGTLRFESEPGEGTQAVLEIPCQ